MVMEIVVVVVVVIDVVAVTLKYIFMRVCLILEVSLNTTAEY